MGTNYYARRNSCEHCGRGDDELHIGKSSGGWSFSFHAYREWETWDDDPIDSYARWLEVLSEPGVTIRNEYGEDVTLDKLKELIASKVNGTKHAEYVKTDPLCQRFCKPGDDWLDDEGHSFSRGDFS